MGRAVIGRGHWRSGMFEPPLVRDLRQRLDAANAALLVIAEECLRAEAKDGRVSRRVLQRILREADHDHAALAIRRAG